MLARTGAGHGLNSDLLNQRPQFPNQQMVNSSAICQHSCKLARDMLILAFDRDTGMYHWMEGTWYKTSWVGWISFSQCGGDFHIRKWWGSFQMKCAEITGIGRGMLLEIWNATGLHLLHAGCRTVSAFRKGHTIECVNIAQNGWTGAQDWRG